MKLKLRYVGLDVHADTIVVAVADEGRGEAKVVQKIAHDWHTLHALLKRLSPEATLLICYEAGPTGYGMYRKMQSAGFDCQALRDLSRARGAAKGSRGYKLLLLSYSPQEACQFAGHRDHRFLPTLAMTKQMERQRPRAADPCPFPSSLFAAKAPFRRT